MLSPSITGLLDKVDSRYTLVVLAAKRAREINNSRLGQPEPDDDVKAVSVAVNEIMDDKITYTRETRKCCCEDAEEAVEAVAEVTADDTVTEEVPVE
ncbi:MAG: DNA-directed RNA polymerase subunit omega [Clostridia bacterium]|nr:DNA-directed RNA polymerase subunit omega [Clostridia bacterium]